MKYQYNRAHHQLSTEVSDSGGTGWGSMALSLASYGIGIGVIATTCAVSGAVVRWSRVHEWWQSFRQTRRGEYDLQQICTEFLSALTNHVDRRTLYTAVLRYVARLSGTDCASVLTRNGDPKRFLLRESLGVRPGSFHVGDIWSFFEVLRDRGAAVTRKQLIHDPALADIKHIGLQYCVQFHADVCVPCFLGGELVAVINLGGRKRGAYSKRLLEVLQLLSGQAALAIHNARLYDNLNEQHAELRELNELKGHLLANVSHELRTPLTSIIGLTDHLLDADADVTAEEREHFVGMVNQSGKRLLTTVTSLLDLAKLETDRTNLRIQRLNVGQMLGTLCSKLQVSPTTEVMNLASEAPCVYADPQWIECLFEHVLGNAAKYTPHGKIWIDARPAGEMLELVVHDTGIGIPKDKLQDVFREFTQVSNGTDRLYEGTGVGLNIARKVAELHGGRIWMKSQPGEGSHVHITLPLRPTSLR